MIKKQKLFFRFPRDKKTRGFTLVEALIAVFLTLIVFLGVFGGFQLAVKVTSQTRIRIQAVFAASQRIEEIRGLKFEDIERGVGQ